MKLPFELERPLAFLDVESTGVDPQKDRIVELSIALFQPGQEEPTIKTRRFNPDVPIPEDATAVHGISNDDVAAEPYFRQIATDLALWLDDTDLAGFNARRFDVPILIAELERAGQNFDMTGRRILDPMAIFHRAEPRGLEAAVRFYLDRDHEGAHGAEADVLATVEVLAAQVGRYELPSGVQELHAHCDEMWKYRSPIDRWWDTTDPDPKKWTFRFGKHKGVEFGRVPRDYLFWMVDKADDIHPTVSDMALKMIKGRFG